MTTLNTKILRVPKEYRNKRIYQGAVTVSVIGGLAGGGGAPSYTAGNGIAIVGGEIAMSSPYTGAFTFTGKVTSQNGLTVTGGSAEITSGNIVPIVMNTAAAQSLIQIKQGGADKGFFGYSNSGSTGIAIYDSTLSTVNLMVTDAGKVGIGNPAPEYDLDVTGHCRITGSPLFGNHVLSLTDGTRDIGQIGGGYFRHGYFLGSVYSNDSVVLNWKDTPQILDADNEGLFTGSVFRFGTHIYSKDTTFQSGFTGKGWKLTKTGSAEEATYGLEVDSLRVRGSMNVYEMIINKIRATNGSLWVSDACELSDVVFVSGDSYRCYVDDHTNNPQPFAVNDIIKCQIYWLGNVKEWQGRINSIDAGGEYFVVNLDASAPDIPEIGDTVVRIGNVTDEDRQGSIYLTSSDSNAPYLEILDDYDTAYEPFADKSVLRLGNLDGLTDGDFPTLGGYGLYTTHAFLKGGIHAAFGKIANWVLSGNRIQSVGGTYGTGIYIDSVGDAAATGIGLYIYRSTAPV
ncbi:unnamed protein product, partial [marine sediment metagenome]